MGGKTLVGRLICTSFPLSSKIVLYSACFRQLLCPFRLIEVFGLGAALPFLPQIRGMWLVISRGT